jgi:uracil-DNA glycosylase
LFAGVARYRCALEGVGEMTIAFDVGYAAEPYRTLCAAYPDESIYPSADFRTEWGPIFHRGRLDGSARVLSLGQDPAVQENVTRRILVGAAGKRVQGFLAKLGVTRSYVLVNTFLYSVFGQSGGQKHMKDAKIAAYRNRWLDALLVDSRVQAVVALGGLADDAWNAYVDTSSGTKVKSRATYVHVPHPTYPISASGGDANKLAELTKEMLEKWNTALETLRGVVTPDAAIAWKPYGQAFEPGDLPDIPPGDLPPGTPAWMANEDGWGKRTGASTNEKRATITITVPKAYLP